MKWFKQYNKESITESNENQTCLSDSKRPYRFGDGKRLQTIKSAKIPDLIGNQSPHILTDIVDADIPLVPFEGVHEKVQHENRFSN